MPFERRRNGRNVSKPIRTAVSSTPIANSSKNPLREPVVASLAVASAAATFATPGVNIGAFCATPSVALGRAVGRMHAMEMLLTGEAIGAERAREIGLVNRVVAPEALDAEVEALARLIASKSPAAIASGKAVFYRQLEMPLDEAYAVAGKAIACDFFGADGKEGVDAFLGKRPPRWKARSSGC